MRQFLPTNARTPGNPRDVDRHASTPTGGDPPGCIQDSARHPVDGPPECTFPGKPEGCQPSCKDGAGTTPPGCFDEECEIEDYRDSDYQNTVGASAIEWIDEINGRGLSNGPLLIVVSSGNALLPPSEAVFTSTYVHAGLGASPITGFSGGVLEVRDPLTNTIAVESRDRAYIDPATDEVRALGRDQGDGTIGGGGSNQIGQLSGIGVDVYSTLDGSFAAGLESGTSMAAPQVAGLATYVWSLDSNLQADQVMQILTDTANTIPGGPPIIDAYAAVLTVDNPPPYSSVVVATARVRGAVMDENEDSLFDAADIEAFVNAFSAATPGEYDYSRWDLNGDGKTGGCDTAPFNLDISEPRDIKSVEQIVEGQPKQYPEGARRIRTYSVTTRIQICTISVARWREWTPTEIPSTRASDGGCLTASATTLVPASRPLPPPRAPNPWLPPKR